MGTNIMSTNIMGIRTLIAVLMVSAAVSGCTRSTNALNVNTQAPPQPLPSVPSGNVETAQLDPIDNAVVEPNSPLNAPTTTEVPEAPQVETAPVEVAAIEPPKPSNEPLTHEPLAGSWNVASDSAQCRAILAFTRWSGGYRATTLRCSAPELKTVTAWDVKGSRVVLVDSNGSQVASLTSVGAERYSGTTSSGKPITFSR